MSRLDAVIVGAGLSGLCCARRLKESGADFLVLEASDAVGGRVRTDEEQGFLLDRGFQVLLTAYPEAEEVLDYGALDLHPFFPGALVRLGGRFHRVADPFREPVAGLLTLFSAVGTLGDKLRMARLRVRAGEGSLEEMFDQPETPTLRALRDLDFSESMIDAFFRPFLGGVFLERGLTTSSRMMDFVVRMFSLGDAALPSRGMGAIPSQIASALPEGSIRLRSRVVSVEPGAVALDTGERLEARAVVVAAEGPEASRLVPEIPPSGSRGTTCLYFVADRPPVTEPILVLDGDGTGPVNNLCVMSRVAPGYAPSGAALISASVLGVPAMPEAQLVSSVLRQMQGWFGGSTDEWKLLRSYRIPHALPVQDPPALEPPERPVRVRPGLFVCGDHRDQGSIQGAMVSGRRAAETILRTLL